MNWEEKLYAIQSLCGALNVAIRMRGLGDWYVHDVIDIKDGSILKGDYGNGYSPQEAVEKHWEILTNLEPHQYLVVHASSDKRKAVRWNGFMWEIVQEDV